MVFGSEAYGFAQDETWRSIGFESGFSDLGPQLGKANCIQCYGVQSHEVRVQQPFEWAPKGTI